MEPMTTVAPRFPSATYRVQFNQAFPFRAATRVVPYLHGLGITDCYASSYLKAVPGSTHGYDVVDPTTLNPELGSEDEYREFVRSLRAHDMSHLLDLVPNHMGIGESANRWWLDVLEHGPSSRFAGVFDIDWQPIKRELDGKVLLPILGDLYGTVLERGEIGLAFADGGFVLRYYNHTLPVAPKSWVKLLSHRLERLIAEVGDDAPAVLELESIITALGHLPSRSEIDPPRVRERYREKEIARGRLAALVRDSAAVAAFIEENVGLFNGTKGDPRSFDLLDDLLNDQPYRLAYWRVASEEINYRRFFDVNELAAIRMEDEAVLKETHRLIFALLKERVVTGLRIDHVDGLYDPGRYLRQLQAWAGRELLPSTEQEAAADRPLFIVVEKILDRDEPLPETWPVYGTTGYDFLNLVNGLFVQGAHERAMDETYARFIHSRRSYEDLIYESKQLIMRVSMASEINVLGHRLNRLSERDRRSRDFTLNSLTHAIREIIACFPVYRTYVTDGPEPVLERDRAYVRRAVAWAKRRNPALSGLVFDFVQTLLLKEWDERTLEHRREQLEFVMKFQQTTSPVTAKGVEDTAFYLYNRLVSLNEVGGDPQQFGVPPALFHKRMRERQARWPCSLSATATHDTKRGEDVRARIDVLSELPQEWRARVTRWSRLTRRLKAEVDGRPAPDRNEEYLLYQTLVGAWPLTPPDDREYRVFCDRIQGYMHKALREAKVHTSWVNPNQAHEDAVSRFIAALLDRSRPNLFLEDFLPFQERIARYGACNSLAQVLLKITAPGIPDFYQGTELWDFSLVDPDNRRPVDYDLRAGLLADLQKACDEAGEDRRGLVARLIETYRDGRIKLYVTMTGLRSRREHPDLFLHGDYVPLEARGERPDYLLAFARIHRDRAVVAAITRLAAGLGRSAEPFPLGRGAWGETWLTVPSWRPGSPYRNLLTGEMLATTEAEGAQVLPAAEVFAACPVALLERLS